MGSKRERPGSEKKRKKRAKTNGVDSPNPKTAGKDEKVDKKKDKKSSSKTPSKSSTEKPAKASTTKSETVRRQEAASQSVFLKKKIQLVVSLYPGSLRNCEESVEDSIRHLLLKYSDGLGGILMAYDNVRLKGDGTGEAKGWIMNELPFIHYNATCDALVFCPKVGSEVSIF